MRAGTNKIQKRKHRRNKKTKVTRKHRRNKKILPIVYGKLYMTGCIHCENLAPEWEIVTNKLKIHLDVVCYDIERSEEQQKLSKFNDIYKPYEPLQIQGGYPTLYKLHKRGGAIVYYNGQRDNVSILKWLQG
jgi:flavoprotein